jgi:ATP phosphoribosyltransferase regulatory subunit
MLPAPTAPLLPPGFADLLPPQAETLRQAREAMLGTLRGWGYRLVRPPLLETDTALFEGAGDNRPGNTFRLSDPQSREMLAIRADMTPQIGRIAATRLKSARRPLRLCYAGDVLRAQVSGHDPARQMVQVGAELIGAPIGTSIDTPSGPQAVAEIILLASAACRAAGLADLSIDLCLPALVGDLIREAGLPHWQRGLLAAALQHKDAGALPDTLSPAVRTLCLALLDCVGPVAVVLPYLQRLPLLNDWQRELVASVGTLAALLPLQDPNLNLNLTIDLSERQGFSFQSGICFSIFASGLRGEVGRGGAYQLDLTGENAVGFSVYLDPLLRVLPDATPPQLVLVPLQLDAATEASLRARAGLCGKAWVLVRSLSADGPSEAEARALGCSALWMNETLQEFEIR